MTKPTKHPPIIPASPPATVPITGTTEPIAAPATAPAVVPTTGFVGEFMMLSTCLLSPANKFIPRYRVNTIEDKIPLSPSKSFS